MRICFVLVIFSAVFVAIRGKKCCNSECTQVISQARSFREYFPEDSDGLKLERDAKIWIFMKEVGTNDEGEEIWFGESKGSKGYFPKHLIGEYMVLCRDLVEIDENREILQGGDGKQDEKRESQEHGDPNEAENREIQQGEETIDTQKQPESDENREIESKDSDFSKEDSKEATNKGQIPDMVNEWRKQDGETFQIPPAENIAEFHAPNTEAMQALKREMDLDFLNRILEGEGVETVEELDQERLNDLMRDPEAARILIGAFQVEPENTPDRDPREISQPVRDEEEKSNPEENKDREISQPVENKEEVGSPGEIEDREISQPDRNEEEISQPEESEDREISQPNSDETKVPQDEEKNPDLEISQGENVDEGDFDTTKSDVDNQESVPQEENLGDENLDIPQTNGDTNEQKVTQGEILDEGKSNDAIENNEISRDESPTIEAPPTHESSHSEITAPLNLLPYPISQLLNSFIESHGIASLLFYTLTPLIIAYLYLSRNFARKRVDAHKKESAKHVKVLEQKVVVLQKEKKALELRIAESDENAVSREELQNLRQEIDTARKEIEGNRYYISQLESDCTQRGEEIQVSQACVNEKCSQIERLQTLNSSAQEEILALNSKMEAVSNQVTQVETQKMALQVRIDANIDSYSELKDKLDGVEKSRDQVERDKIKLQEELKEKQVLITANAEQIHTLDGEIGVLSKSLLKLQPGGELSNTDKTAVFNTLTNTAKALSELEEARGVKERLELENSHFKTDNTALKAKCEDLDDNLSCLKSSNILLKKQLGDSETKLQVLNEYFNTKESELHRQLNEVKNSQMLLEGKDQRTHEEIGSVRMEREALKTEISGLKQQHSEREKSLLEQISSLEKRAQENLYNSRRNEQDIRWRDREITELKRKLGESSLPSSQSETYLSPRSTSPSSQISSNSDTEGGSKGDKTRESPSLPKFTSGPPNRVDTMVTTTAKQQTNPYPQGYPPPPHGYYPPPYPAMMPPFPPPLLPQGMAPAVFNSPSVSAKRGKHANARHSAPDDSRPIYAPEKANTHQDNFAPKQNFPPNINLDMAPQSNYALNVATHQEHLAPKPVYAPDGATSSVENLVPKPALYAPSPPTLIDAPNEYTHQPALFDTSPDNGAQQYNGSLLDSQNNTPTQNDPNAFLIDV